MDEQTKQAVANALDNALATVAMREYGRLSSGLNPIQRADRVEDTLKSFNRIGYEMPNYDKWVALFYHWYQPSQINLAYSLIKSITRVPERLYVVDYACGALAMQFGVALAVADALEQGQCVSDVRIDSIDPSQAMVNMGQKIWEQFKLVVNKDARLRHVRSACEIISPQTNPTKVAIDGNIKWATFTESSRWFSALHAVYPDNKDSLQWHTYDRIRSLNPDACFATAISRKGRELRDIWRFMDDNANYDRTLNPSIKRQFTGELPEITRWRRNLNALPSDNEYWSWLNEPIKWHWHSLNILIYKSRSFWSYLDHLDGY